jgi:hypothetical protein
MPVMYHVDSFHPGRVLASRTEVMDTIEGRQVALTQLKAGRALVEIIGVDMTGPFVVATYQPASAAGLHTRPSRD